MAKVDVIRHYSQATTTMLQSFLERHNHRLVVLNHNGLIYLGVREQLEEIPLTSVNVKPRVDLYMPLGDMKRLITDLGNQGVTPAGSVSPQTHQPVTGAKAIVALPKIITNQGKAPKVGCFSRRPAGDVVGFDGGYVYIDIQTAQQNQAGWQNQPVMEAFELHFGMDGTPSEVNATNLPGDLGFAIILNEGQASSLLKHLMDLDARILYTIQGTGPGTVFDLYVDGKHFQATKSFTQVTY